MKWRRERLQRARDAAAALQTEHERVRARLLATVERTEQYASDLLAEVHRWSEARKGQT